MKKIRFVEAMLILGMVIGLVLAGSFLADLRKTANLDSQLQAAVTNPTTASPGYMMVNIPLVGTTTGNGFGLGSITGKMRFKMPWPATLIGVSGIYRTGGTNGAMTIDITEAGSSVLSTPILINSTTAQEGTISDSAIADEALIGINTAVTSTETCTAFLDPTVQLIFKRR